MKLLGLFGLLVTAAGSVPNIDEVQDDSSNKIHWSATPPGVQSEVVTLLGEDSTFDPPQCDSPVDASNTFKVDVLVALSCDIRGSQARAITTWINWFDSTADKYFQNQRKTDIVFKFAHITDCSSPALVADDGFTFDQGPRSKADFYPELPAWNGYQPNAVISFVTDTTDALVVNTMLNYESTNKIKITHNFILCPTGSCQQVYPGLTSLRDTMALDNFDLFLLARGYHCARLPNAIPISFTIDNTTIRECRCICPSGSQAFKEADNNWICKTVIEAPEGSCIWNKNYKYDVKQNPTTCSIDNIATDYGVDVPFPFDNYVSETRANIDTSAYIDLQASNDQQVPWNLYQKSPKSYVDKMSFTNGFGTYTMTMTAKDYTGSDTCSGCIAFNDNQRPTHSTICPTPKCWKDNPASICYRGMTQFDTTSKSDVLDLVAQFYKFQTAAVNDPCKSERCDIQRFMYKDFTETMRTDISTGSFNTAVQKITDFEKDFFALATIEDNVFDSNRVTKATVGKRSTCARCLDLAVQLKELVTTYECNQAPSAPTCVGDDYCVYQECLLVRGNTFVQQASVTIKQTVKDVSKATIGDIERQRSPTAYNYESQIHVGLDCDYLGEMTDLSCTYKSSMAALVDHSIQWQNGANDNSNIVFWRYGIGGQYYKLTDEFTFDQPMTIVEIEAWTLCGQVGQTFFFEVYLHTSGKVIVCDKFDDMWYQSSTNNVVKAGDLCNFPHTDFAELTFDYHPNIGVDYAREELHLEIQNVKCTMELSDPDITNGFTTTPVEIVNQSPAAGAAKDMSPQIVNRFAVELLQHPHTASTTKIDVKCAFTYMNSNTKKLVQPPPCTRTFTAKNCNNPIIGFTDAANLLTCAKTENQAGAFEACSGNIISTNGNGSTVFVPRDGTCCGNGQCKPIFGISSVSQSDIRYCVPTKADNTPYFPTSFALMGWTNKLQDHPVHFIGGLSLLGALVGVTLMVVVRRGRHQQHNSVDGYHPLLD